MTNILINGCLGKMGRAVAEAAAKDPTVEIVAGVDHIVGKNLQIDHKVGDFPMFSRLEDIKREEITPDVVIDFSHASGTDELLQWCKKEGLPCVLCTTGLSEEQVEQVKTVAERNPVLQSANMSLGINLLLQMAELGAKVLGASGFDMEIVEQHHRTKVDAPSGTALLLGEAIRTVLGDEYTYCTDRSKVREQRPEKQIGLHSVRGGTIVGIHDVIFAGTDEVITLNHTAYSRNVFAKGALTGAKYLVGKPAGLYNMKDVILNRM